MKFIKVGNGHYINAALVDELYVSKCDDEEDDLCYEIYADCDGDDFYIDSFDNRADAERALENLVRSLEE